MYLDCQSLFDYHYLTFINLNNFEFKILIYIMGIIKDSFEMFKESSSRKKA